MNRKVITDKPVTKAEMDTAFQVSNRNFGEIIKQLRSDMFIRFDQLVGQLEQIREDQLFMSHDIKTLKATDNEHEGRIKKLEEQVGN